MASINVTLIWHQLEIYAGHLATIGLYGVTAYSVARRTSEIGIRMAMGEEHSGVVAMVMRGAILQTELGLAIGISVPLLCVRFVKAQLYEITGADAIRSVGSSRTDWLICSIAWSPSC
jgi:ABC-type antimicrobial peptide transport system permease subunit